MKPSTQSLGYMESLQRIFALENNNYRLEDQMKTLKTKLSRRDSRISDLQCEVANLKKKLKKKERESRIVHETVLSVG